MKNRCEGCKYAKIIEAQDRYKFAGCFKKPYQGKPVSEIKKCPIEKEKKYKTL